MHEKKKKKRESIPSIQVKATIKENSSKKKTPTLKGNVHVQL